MLKHLPARCTACRADEAGRGRAGRFGDANRRHLKQGDEIRLTGLGILQVRKSAARIGTEPRDW